LPRPNLIQAPVGRTLLRLAGPMVLGLLAVIMFNVVDSFWVGKLGASELAAMSFTFPVSLLVMSISMGMGVGMTSVVSRFIGAGEMQRVRRLTTDGLLLANGLVVLFAGLGRLTIDPLFRALGADAELLPLIRQYMVPWYLGIGFLVIPMVGNAAIRATGDTRTPSFIMIIAGIVNFILDPLLILGIGPFPRLEMRGAALTTVAAYAITFVTAIWILHHRERMLVWARPKPSEFLDSARRILHVALPSIGTQLLAPLASGVLTRMVASYGTEVVAGFGVGTRVEALSLIGVSALASALAPFVGQNSGAGRIDRVREAFAFSVKVTFVYGLLLTGLLAWLAEPIGRMFTDHAAVVEATRGYLRIVPISFGLFGAMFIGSSAFNASGRPFRSATLIFVRLFVLAVPLAWIGSRWLGITGLFAGISVANAAVGILAMFLARATFRDRSPAAAEASSRAA
jgi:putative MATE family efflux protein